MYVKYELSFCSPLNANGERERGVGVSAFLRTRKREEEESWILPPPEE